MSASLVGSEMCIRDRFSSESMSLSRTALVVRRGVCALPFRSGATVYFCPVSYTHLTLPTICSV
eukprot:7853856-Alexandrium_andersonii.AAC.1